ncbi:patatin-like phospholipase family protein [Hyunsoonleella flava]|uniref:patatin-like phospholipase family protein n=1 Tax=Hyunsoonleella flava TaxID=2527939 RepID=UPI002680743D|nr:patatin-like phospholipase family protein [Hyunsoonleella flava]
MKIKTTILTLLLLITFSANAQNQVEDNSRPKVGLVLSGGGAKGLAHIGALKVLDTLGVKVDYVAGTSMGAIIGSLYASGYTGKELDSIFNSIDFDKIISDDLPRASKAFYERNNAERYAITLPFDNFNLKLPSALSRGQNTYNLLSKLMLHVSDINDFENLPIPFFCIATNIETGKQVLLNKGNLTHAVMASGALPSLFQPVKIDNQILIDGGVVNNYPIDELRAKGMDIIIGVDVQDGLLNIEELTSAPDVLIQINNFRTINDMKLKAPKTDIYIKPDIKDFNVVSFNQGNNIIANGAKAAIENIEALKQLPKAKNSNINSVVKKVVRDSIKIRNIKVKGNSKYTRSYILGKLKLKGGEKVSYKNVVKGLNSLIATNNFDSFYYDLEPTDEKDTYDLLAEVNETETTTFLKLGVHYDDLYKSGALINLTKKSLLFGNDVISLDMVFGDNVRYDFNYLIDKGFYWSVGLRSRYNAFKKDVNAELLLDDTQITSTGLNKVNASLHDQTNQFYLQTLFRKDFALSLGAEHKRLEVTSETIANTNQDEFVFESTDYFSAFGKLKLDTYDNKYFPKRGVFFNGDFHTYLFASRFNEDFESFSIASATMGYAFSVSPKVSFNLQTGGGFKLGDKSTTTLDFALGGYGNNLINNFIPFYGYDFISLTGNSYVKAYFSMDYEVFNKHHITLEGNWANVDDDIFETGEWFTLPDYRGYALGYALESFIGPIQIKYSYSPEQRDSVWYFNVGFWF